MAPGFKKKKIYPQKTLGDILKNKRLRKKLTIEEAENATHVRARFLIAIEDDAWSELPSEIYSRGFIERYAEFLSLNRQEILKKFDQNRHLYRKMGFSNLDNQKSCRPITTMWLVTPKMIALMVGLIALVSIGSYVTSQVKHFSAAPDLAIEYPTAFGKQYINGDTISLSGKTTPDSQLQINGQLVEVASDGSFTQAVGLNKGENNILVTAKNRSQKSRAEVVTIIANY